MNKKSKIAPFVASWKDGIFYVMVRNPLNNGKLIDVNVPDKIQMEQYNTWHDNYESYKRIKYVIEQSITNATTEEEQLEYKKQLQAHVNTFRPAPSITKWTKIRARVGKATEKGQTIEPAYEKDHKIIQKLNY